MILVGGGSRSGKTSHALSLAREAGPRRAYIATAQLLDDEMRARAAAHRAERGSDFVTIEERFHVAGILKVRSREFDSIIVDCLTLWLSNQMLAGGVDPRTSAIELADAAAACDARVILITNEVGCGIVPENELARRFRDESGWINQLMARRAREVWWMIFGCPLRVKS